MSDEQQYLRGVSAAAREQDEKVAALAAGMGSPFDHLNEVARPTEPVSTGWPGPACTPGSPPPAEPSRFDNAALLLAAAVVGSFVGAGLAQLVPYLLRLAGWLA